MAASAAEMEADHSVSAVHEPADAPAQLVAEDVTSEADFAPWRDELSARLSRYRARRKMRPPRYPSLRLRFETAEPGAMVSPSHSGVYEPLSDRSLALDTMQPTVERECAQPPQPLVTEPAIRPPERPTAKIIEFPRVSWDPPAPPPDELAEPVGERPRILEAPEIAPPAPALGGITIEPAEVKDAEKRPGIDLPLQTASLSRRLAAGAVDAVLVLSASGMFGAIFWKVSATRPPLFQTLGLAVAIPCLCWIAYQYLLIVYSASTPGLLVAGLRLGRFDGLAAHRSLRRWRVLASCMSAASLGMGYLWLFLDEDGLCWHDRITRTHLGPKPKAQ
jgi:hypothetical protein